MKRFLAFCLMLIIVATSTAYAAGSEFKTGPYYMIADFIQEFQTIHPELTVTSGPTDYRTTDDLISAFLTGTFDLDAVELSTLSFDIDPIIGKGYLADLSSNATIAETVSKMYPDIQKVVTRNGKIYGLPVGISFDFLSIDPSVWKEAGLTEKDIPTTFGEFLDFLERWIAWTKSGANERHFVINGYFDEVLYNEGSYCAFLSELLLNNYMMQLDYAGEELTFDSAELRTLLERCDAIGHQLYEVESNPLAGPSLLVNGVLASMENLLCLRITADQPKLIKAYLAIMVVNADSEQQTLGQELALLNLQSKQTIGEAAYLFQAAEPVRDPYYDENIATWQKKVNDLQAQLDSTQNLTAEARGKLEGDLEQYRATLDEVSAPENEYMISQNDLDIYKQYADSIYIQMPGVFSIGTENGRMLQQLIDRYAAGLVTVDQLIQRLEEVAWMVQMEGN